MKYLKIADGISRLFPKKVSVDLVHAVKGLKIGTYKLNSELIPETFNKPTILEIQDRQWQITKAVCVREESYLQGKKLTLYVQEAETFVMHDRFVVPTKDNNLSALSDVSLFDQFTLAMTIDDWCQLEFLPLSQLANIQEELNVIDAILADCKDALLGYDRLHVREKIRKNSQAITFDEFCNLVDAREKGGISFERNVFVENGFAVRSMNYTYYGLMQNNIITDLCLEQFENVDEEFINLITKFELVFVDWCNAKILLHQIPEGVNVEQTAARDGDWGGDGAVL